MPSADLIDGSTIEMMLNNPLVAAILMIAYFQYELSYGKLSKFLSNQENVIAAVIAIAEKVEGVNHRSIMSDFSDVSSGFRYVDREPEDEEKAELDA